MRSRRRGLSVVALAVLLGACAGPNKLATQSEKALAAGEPQKAYEKARSALRKDPENERARGAMRAAAERLALGRRDGILAVAAHDTVTAARQSLAFDAFRRELADYRITLAPDSAFESRERSIREGSARFYYRRAEDAMLARLPKSAYDDFSAAREFVPGYRDVDARIAEAYAEALTRVALLPFSNQTGVRGLPKEMADRIHREIGRRVHAKEFRFTELLGRDAVYGKVTVADLDRMGRRDAIRVGRDLEADQVITGRFYGLRSKTDTERYHHTIFRKVVDRDDKGASRERFIERDIDIVSRVRDVLVSFDFEVLDTEDGAVLASGTKGVEAAAHALYTSFQAEGDCDDYCLAPPDLKRSNPDRVRQIESDWNERFGSWTLPELLERARKDAGRTRYRSADRDEFIGNTTARPVFLGDLPPEDDLAIIALQDVWRPVLAALRDLDRRY